MLTIDITNDKTGTDDAANYHYQAAVNRIIVAEGRIEGHDPADRWRALVREVVAPGMLAVCKSALRWLEWGQYQGGGEDEWLKKCLRAAIADTEGDNAKTSDT